MTKEYEKIPDLIHRALSYGIKMDNLSRQERKEYLLDLSDYVNRDSNFTSDFQEDRIIIETKYMDPILMVRMRNGTLEFTPLAEGSFFDSFMTVLSFISMKTKEKEILKEFKVFIDEVDKEILEDKDTEELDKSQPEENTEDDFDWV
tara:strand:- start:59 stop:499 length:441 start_codon:yes stop_codon:yes gene_type:complete